MFQVYPREHNDDVWNSGDTTGKLVRLNANCESDSIDSEASLKSRGSISPIQDMESESILPKANIFAQISSNATNACTSINYIVQAIL